MEDKMRNKMENKNKTIRNIIKYILIIFILVIFILVTYNVVTVNKKYYKHEKEINIPIFVYHDIVENDNEIKYDYMQTSVKKYKEQILGLKSLGYEFITYQDLIEYDKGKKALAKNSCIITFDDGLDGVYQYAYPISKEYSIPITAFIINNSIGDDGCFSWEEAKEMQESGYVEIASHSINHPKFEEITSEEAIENVKNSYDEISEKTGSKAKIFTYPYGIYTDEQKEKLKEEGFIQNLTDNKINISSKLDIYGLHRCYPLNDSVPKILLKKVYRQIKYK